MKSTVKKTENSAVELEIEVSSEELDKFFEQEVAEIGQGLEIEGFRKGRAPKAMVIEKVGREKILVEAAEHAISHNYKDAVIEHNLEPISQPEVEIMKLAIGNPLVFKVKVSVLPEINLPDYKKIALNVKREKAEVTDKEIDDTMRWLQKSRAKYTLKNESVQKGDFVEIEYSSPQIPETLQDKGQKDGFILGEGKFIPGFEEKIAGMKAGEEKSFSLVMPKNHPTEALREKKVEFNVKVTAVHNTQLPEINDELAKSMGKFNNIDELKKNIKEGISFEKEEAETQKAREKILENISKEASFEIPEALIGREKENIMENARHEVSHLGISFEEYLKKINKTEKELDASFAVEAREKVKKFLILREIGNKEKITATEAEVEEEMNKVLRQYPDIKTAKSKVDLERIKEYNRGVIVNRKIFELLENSSDK